MLWLAYIYIPAINGGEKEKNKILRLCSMHAGAVEPEDKTPGIFLDLGRADPVKPLKQLATSVTALNAGPVTAGLAESKLMAKALCLAFLANHKKDLQIHTLPGGTLAGISPGKEENYLSGLPIQFLWPLGPKTRDKLLALGIKRVGDIAELPPRALAQHFGREAKKITACYRGKDTETISSLYPRKEVIFTRTGPLYGSGQLYSYLAEVSSSLAAELKKSGSGCDELEIIFYSENESVMKRRHFQRSTWSAESIQEALYSLAAKLPPRNCTEKVQIKVSGLSPVCHRQPGLFDSLQKVSNGYGKTDEIKTLTNRLQQKYGPGTINFAARAFYPDRQQKILARWDPFVKTSAL